MQTYYTVWATGVIFRKQSPEPMFSVVGSMVAISVCATGIRPRSDIFYMAGDELL